MTKPHYVFTTSSANAYHASVMRAIEAGLYFDASYNPDDGLYTIAYTGEY